VLGKMKWNDARAELQDSTKTSNMMRTDSSMATCSYTLTQARLLRREKQGKGEIESAAHQEIAAAVVQVEGDGASTAQRGPWRQQVQRTPAAYLGQKRAIVPSEFWRRQKWENKRGKRG
jgi:hypothetical protein